MYRCRAIGFRGFGELFVLVIEIAQSEIDRGAMVFISSLLQENNGGRDVCLKQIDRPL